MQNQCIYFCQAVETDKSNLEKAIYSSILKILPYHWKDPEKPTVLLFGLAEIPVADIEGATIYYSLWINLLLVKKFLGLNNKPKAASRNWLS